MSYYTGVVRPTTESGAIRRARGPEHGAASALLSVFFVVAMLLAPGAGSALGAPKRPPAHAIWGPILQIWNIAFEEIPVGPPAFDSTSAYVALRDGRIAAVNLATGAVRWSNNQGVTAPPAAFGGLVFVVKDATLVGLDSATGKGGWQRALGSPAVMAPTAGALGVVVVTTKPELILLKPIDGTVSWRQPLAAPARAAPVADADRVYVGLANGNVIAVSAKTGAIEWTRKIGGQPLVLTLSGDKLFVGTSDDFLCALVASSGRQKWQWRTGGDVGGTVAADDKRVYFSSLDNSLVALGKGGGDLKWQQRLPSRPVGGPVLVGDTLLLATIASELRTFEIDHGTQTESMDLTGRPLHPPHVVPWSGLVPPRAIMLTAGGQLMAVGPVVEPPLTPFDLLWAGVVIASETLDSIEPPLVPMIYPPGRLLMPESLPPAVIKKRPTRQP